MILVLGGTYESRLVVDFMREKTLCFTLATATNYWTEWNSALGDEEHLVIRFTEESLREFIKKRHISTIVDSTHPFARKVSELAMKVAENTGVNYIRYERLSVKLPKKYFLVPVQNSEEAMEHLMKTPGNILLTVGVQSLPFYAKAMSNSMKRLFVRVLPRSSSLEICEQCNIIPSHIIAMEGPFDEELNRMMIRKFRIKAMLTKESGAAGGLKEKIDACEKEKVKLIVIRFPRVIYPQIAHNLEELGRLLCCKAAGT
jgi:precorrin-6A/cobalt-precorrin-6A reductase